MTIEATGNQALVPKTAEGPIIHPRWVRLTHWVNALAIFMMIGSGWQIYDASPLFRFIYFSPHLALGQWLAGALLWHFAAMWLLMVNGLIYLALGFSTGRFANKLLPLTPKSAKPPSIAGGPIRPLSSPMPLPATPPTNFISLIPDRFTPT